MKNARVGLWVLCLGSLLCCSAAFAVQYQIIDLGDLGVVGKSSASSINNNGQIVGRALGKYVPQYSDCYQATLFDPTGSGANTNLKSLYVGSDDFNGGYYSSGYSINNNGTIVGAADINSTHYNYHATLFDSTGSGNNRDLGTLGGYSLSTATCINDNNQIVGYARSLNNYRAVLFDFTEAGHNFDLGTVGGNMSYANSINNDGQIVGWAYNNSNKSRATIFDSTGGGNNKDLGTLFGGGESAAEAINNSGQIVGLGYNSSGKIHATFFDSTGAGNNIDLGALGLDTDSWALSINNNGQIVGYSYLAGNLLTPHATFFDPTGVGNNIDLNTLLPQNSGWTLGYANSINDNGWIVGDGINPSGKWHAYLLKPIPEPGSLILLAAGTIVCRLRRRR